MSRAEDAAAALWPGVQPVALSRVEVIEAYARALADGRDEPGLRADAATAAHRLAGALGSYGRTGSDAAAVLEQLLLDASAVPGADAVAGAAAVLRDAVEA